MRWPSTIKNQLAWLSYNKKKKHFIGCAILRIDQSVSLLEQISGIIWKQTSEKSTVYYPVAVENCAVLFKLNGVVWGLGENPGALGFIHGWHSSPDVLNGRRALASVSHPTCLLTIRGAESVLVGVVCWCHLDRSGGREHQDVGAGGVLGGVELRWLQVERSAPAKHRPHSDSVFQNRGNGRDVNLHHLQNAHSVPS